VLVPSAADPEEEVTAEVEVLLALLEEEAFRHAEGALLLDEEA